MALVLASPWLVPPEAHAQDGGSRSAFAQGVGNRALGMGGAFVALADDASGLLWNPGGLSRAPRFEVQAGQASYFAPGVSETYLTAVLPSWRWGGAAATFRHIGVGGIEQRDDRNQVVGGSISDSQSEFAFGYGRPVNENWSVGAAFRARHQDLAGYSANGFGVDLGVTGRPSLPFGRSDWTENVIWGLALTNVVKPTLRLNQESVGDPMTVRSGLAYRIPLSGFTQVTAALDLEKPAGLGSSVHAGVEMQVLSQFGLRAGMNRGRMTAGTSFRWRDFACDYAYESRTLEPVHRVGIRYSFGATVVEARAAAGKAEERRLEALLDEGVQRRQSEQITSLLARANERRAAGELDEAIDLLGTVTALDTTRTDAVELEAACHREKGLQLEAAGDFAGAAIAFGRAVSLAPADTAAASGQMRCQAESDRRSLRSTEARGWFAQALDALGSGDLVAARRGFRRVLQIEPNDADAAAMLRRAEDAIARRAQGYARDAGRSLEAGRIEDASALIEQAAALDPATDGLAALRSSIYRARAAENSARASARATPRAPAPEQKHMSRKELDQMFRRGVDAMKERRSDDALRFWELVWSADHNYPQVGDYVKRECLTRGMEAFATGRLDEAVGFWQRALRIDPNDPRALGYLDASPEAARTHPRDPGQQSLDSSSEGTDMSAALELSTEANEDSGIPPESARILQLPQRRARFGIRWIVVATSASLITAAVLGVGWVSERNTREALTREIEARLLLQGRSLALAGAEALLSDFPELTLHPLARELKKRQAELSMVVVVDRFNKIQGAPDPGRIEPDLLLQASDAAGAGAPGARRGRRHVQDGVILVASVPVSHRDGRRMGTAVVGLPLRYVEQVIERARRQQFLVLALVLLVGIAAAGGIMSFVLRPVGVLRAGIERIGRGDLETPLQVRDRTEFGVLAEAVNRMASQLKRAQSMMVERERLARELELARQIQASLLPNSRATAGPFTIHGSNRAAQEVGGDLYDYFELPDGRIGLAIADVSGKGLAGCMVMSMLSALLRAYRESDPSPAALLATLDARLGETLQRGSFVTMFYGVLDPATGELVFANAGHSPLLVFRNATRKTEWHRTRGIPLGAIRNGAIRRTLEDTAITLAPGDLFVQFTDGVNEAFDPSGKEQFGFDRLERKVVEIGAANTDAILAAVHHAVEDWSNSGPPAATTRRCWWWRATRRRPPPFRAPTWVRPANGHSRTARPPKPDSMCSTCSRARARMDATWRFPPPSTRSLRFASGS